MPIVQEFEKSKAVGLGGGGGLKANLGYMIDVPFVCFSQTGFSLWL